MHALLSQRTGEAYPASRSAIGLFSIVLASVVAMRFVFQAGAPKQPWPVCEEMILQLDAPQQTMTRLRVTSAWNRTTRGQ